MIPQVKCDGVDCHFMNYLVYGVALALGLALQACGGGGASSSASGNSNLASDLQTSSYGYKAAVSSFAPQVQVSALTGLTVSDLDTRNVVTFGDFFQEGPGAIAAFVMVNQPGGARPFFLKRNGAAWVDQTSAVLSPTTGCATASSAITADFNGDGRHDVFVTCKDGLGESQWLFISNASTKVFQKIALRAPSGAAYTFKATQAAAADINNDGVMDLVIADPLSGLKFLLGASPVSATAPTFSLAPSRLVNGVVSGGYALPTGIQGVQLIPNASSRFDLIVMGDSSNGFPTWKITGSSDTSVGATSPGTFFYFQDAFAKAFPIGADLSAPWIATDVFLDSGAYYLNLYRSDRPNQMTLAKVDLNLAGEMSARQTSPVTSDGVSARLFPMASGIVAFDGDCPVATSSSRCGLVFNK